MAVGPHPRARHESTHAGDPDVVDEPTRVRGHPARGRLHARAADSGALAHWTVPRSGRHERHADLTGCTVRPPSAARRKCRRRAHPGDAADVRPYRRLPCSLPGQKIPWDARILSLTPRVRSRSGKCHPVRRCGSHCLDCTVRVIASSSSPPVSDHEASSGRTRQGMPKAHSSSLRFQPAASAAAS